MNSGYVSIIGRPNVGKSTLLNNFLGEKVAAVSPKPQTTRNRIMGVHTSAKGQIIFLDTPGIHKPFNKMHQKMVELAISFTHGIDAILLVVDASQEFGKGDEFVLARLSESSVPIIVALNKIDIIRKGKLLPLMDRYHEALSPRAVIPVSALMSDGFSELEDEIFRTLPVLEPPYPADTLSDQPERVLAAEIIREKVFLNTEREVPFCSAVLVDLWEIEGKLLRIAATILVERPTQKGIVIGRGGNMLKKIGTEARLELEGLLDTRIFLQLHVKVKSHWREDERTLRELGFS
jgi:GTP-binding protein Era